MSATSGPLAAAPTAASAEADTEAEGVPVATGPGPTEVWATVPTYRTTAPTSVTLHYEVLRGEAQGAARLTWRVDTSGRYELELRGPSEDATRRPATPALAALTPHWTSRGALDADGIAPERFTVSRRGRERHAANFRREAGIVSFAGPARTWPLVAGAQDRLSWMLQLAAVLQADPALAAEGRQISMMVVGAHGDAGVWTFTVLAAAAVEGPDGAPTAAWHLQRDARHAHDPQVQVWLAPALQHLPVRLRLTLARSGESTEFRLRALQTP